MALQTLKSFVERAQERAFKGRAVLLGASPTHYDLPLPGVPGGSCQVNQKLTWLQERAFKGRAVLLGASPTHYDLPLPGVPGGSCQVNQKLTWLQAQEIRQGDTNVEGFREVERRVLSGSPIQYLDVGPMSDSRPDGHIQNWMDPGETSLSTRDDCRHWCEGGVTDAWLEMLYNTLLY
ncbi:unnamed protein product [Closterium sp. NIES-64]|nr:unnamed protein product [Closterium sp. NIES-64]